jgi:K(+)-stimulated pyrophosphate-energized sodium pump
MRKIFLVITFMMPLPALASTGASLGIPSYWYLVPFAALIALGMALFFYRTMMKKEEGTPLMREIAQYVREGAMAYLSRQYRTVSFVFAGLFVIFVILALLGVQNPFVPVAFLTGGFFSGLCGFLGMKTATYASVRTTNGARHSLNQALVTAFRSGAVMGLVVVGFGLLDISAWFFLLNYVYDHNVLGFGLAIAEKTALGVWDPSLTSNPVWVHAKVVEVTTTMLTFGMGASLQALFARVGGGIYTKAADVGADLVGKVEAGIPLYLLVWGAASIPRPLMWVQTLWVKWKRVFHFICSCGGRHLYQGR